MVNLYECTFLNLDRMTYVSFDKLYNTILVLAKTKFKHFTDKKQITSANR